MQKIKEIKSFPALITAIDSDKGIVEAIVAVMGNIDKGKDRIWKGSFTKTITENFKNIRVLDNHNANSVLDIVGKPLEVRELSKLELPEKLLLSNPNATGGLYTKTQYAMNTAKGFDTFNLLKEGFITEYSIGFVVPRGKSDITNEEYEGKRTPVRNIREVILYEYSPVIWAMGVGTQTMNVSNEQLTLEQKAISLTRYISRIRNEFEATQPKIKPYSDEDYECPEFYSTEVFVDYLMAMPCYAVRENYEFEIYKVGYSYNSLEDVFTFSSREQWIGGSYQFTEGVKDFNPVEENKAGKVLSRANMELVQAVVNAGLALLEAAKTDETEDEKELDTLSDNNSVSEEKLDDSLAEPENNPFTNAQDLEIQKQKYLHLLKIKRLKNA